MTRGRLAVIADPVVVLVMVGAITSVAVKVVGTQPLGATEAQRLDPGRARVAPASRSSACS